ncbi:hypothetical protein OMF40_16640, partial [Bordetella pertussis]
PEMSRGLGDVYKETVIVWGQARADATLGFIAPPEQAGEPMLVALISIIQKIWKPGAAVAT